MIEKLEIQEIEQPTGSEYIIIERAPATSGQMHGKINELVDAVNELQTRSENVQPDVETRSENVQGWEGFKTMSPEQMGYIKLDSDSLAKFLKIHPQYNENGMLNLSSYSVRLKNELDRTRGALNIAIKTLKFIEQQGNCIDVEDEAFDCLEMIKSLGAEL